MKTSKRSLKKRLEAESKTLTIRLSREAYSELVETQVGIKGAYARAGLLELKVTLHGVLNLVIKRGLRALKEQHQKFEAGIELLEGGTHGS